MNLQFANLYRPARFGDVVGQEHAVRFLSGLIRRGKVGRHVLLHGTVGSGKTTLARVFGQALLCQQTEADGSPCGTCGSCRRVLDEEADSGFYEYDVTGSGGGVEAIEKWIADCRMSSRLLPRRFLFLDEAHGLSTDAADSLLKKIEEATDTVFCFATSEHHNLKPSLRSRLVPLQVRPLTYGQAIALLRRTASEAGIEAEDDAFSLLAVMVNRQPRDLLNALGQLQVYDEPISETTLRRLFDFEYLDSLKRYLIAMAAGDADALDRIILEWRDPANVKLRWVLAALAGMYATDILGITDVTDPVLERLVFERRFLVDAMRQTHGYRSVSELAARWRQVLGYWTSDIVAGDEAIVTARFITFHAWLSDAGPAAVTQPIQTSGAVASDNRESRAIAPPTNGSASGFFTFEDVRQVLDLSSFLVQEHGTFFNAYFTIRPRNSEAPRARQSAVAAQFCRDVQREIERIGGTHFAGLWCVEGDNDAVVSRIAVSIPALIGSGELSGVSHVRHWYRQWESDEIGDLDLHLTSAGDQETPLRFHWRCVRDMLSGIGDDVMGVDRDANPIAVKALLKLSTGQREPSLTPLPMVGAAGLLTAEQVAKASSDGMGFLSSVADNAWERVFDGWELKEHGDRQRERAARRQQLADLAAGYPDEGARVAEELRLRNSWNQDPRARPRSWSTWWSAE